MICRCGERTGRFSKAWRRLNLARLARGSATCAAAAKSLRQQDLLNFDGLYKIALADARRNPEGGRSGVRAIAILDEALATAEIASATGRSKRSSTGPAAKSCSSGTPPTPRPPKKLSTRLSPSRSGKARAVLNCARRFHWRSSISRPDVLPRPTPFSPHARRTCARALEMPRDQQAQALLPRLA